MYTAEYTINKKKEKLVKEKLLTIGIITKNECEKLERCLKSLMPLKEAIDCEIIVTDTGSTDNTVEMAKNYADRVLHFEWCNDFAAARNTGIDAAKGLWFMWIDSDEWLENPDDLIKFFKDGEYKKYGSANITLVNLSNFGVQNSGRSNFLRLVILTNKSRFINKVHENIIPINPMKNIDSIIYHDGYILTKEEKQKKHDRNIELLLEEYEINPYNLDLIQNIVRQYLFWEDFKKLNEFCEIGIAAISNEFNSDKAEYLKNMYQLNFNIMKAHGYVNNQEYNEAIDILENIEDDNPLVSYRFIDVHFFLSISYENLKNKEKYLYHAFKYMDYYINMKNFDLTYKVSFEQLSDREKALEKMLYASLDYMQYESIYDENKVIDYILIIRETNLKLDTKRADLEFIDNILGIMHKFQKYNLLTYIYEYVNDIDTETLNLKNFELEILKYMNRNKKESENVLNVLKEIDIETELVKFANIYFSEEVYLIEKIEDFFDKMIKSEFIRTEIVLLCLKNDIDIEKILIYIDVFKFGRLDETTFLEHEDLFDITLRYYKHNLKLEENLRGKYLIVKLIELTMLEKIENIYEAYENLTDILPEVIDKLYNFKFISEENIDILPPIFRFGYFIHKANLFKENRKDNDYLIMLKKAIYHYPIMEKPIKRILIDIEDKLESDKNRVYELELLSKGIKQKIYELITMNQEKEALSVICQLQSIIPDDKELKELKSRIISK